MKRAFTLIELLVVIAIIAILAAILFPVFAQAKEAAKKTQTLSNTKQVGLSILMYNGDADDTFPLSTAVSSGVTTGPCAGDPAGKYYMAEWAVTTPAGADDPGCGTIDGNVWINSTNPYRKSYALTTQAGASQMDTYDAATLAAYTKAPEVTSLSMNGLLNQFSGTAVASPSKNPLVWPGSYKFNWRGAMEFPSNPYLNCSSTGPCVFNASAPPQASTGWDATGRGDAFYTFTNLNSSLWMYGKGFSYCSVDGSAHFVVQGTGGSYNGPALSTDAKGVVSTTLRCSTVAGLTNGFYSSWFRPDSTYSYPTNANRLACGF